MYKICTWLPSWFSCGLVAKQVRVDLKDSMTLEWALWFLRGVRCSTSSPCSIIEHGQPAVVGEKGAFIALNVEMM